MVVDQVEQPSSFTARLVGNLQSGLRHPAARLFIGLYIVSAVVFVAASGDFFTLLIQLGITFWTLLTALVAVSLTRPSVTAWQILPKPSRRRLWLQLGIIVLVLLFSAFRSQALRTPELNEFPVIGPVVSALNQMDFILANPLIYVLLPLVLLLVFGARFKELGLALPATRSDWGRTGMIILIMAFLNIAFIIPALIFGNFTLQAFGWRFFNNVFQNGFSEEFLFRGALMTRLIRLGDVGWGVCISSLIFGLWHISANLSMLDGNLLAAVTFSIISQGIGGVGYAIAMQRGGTLVTPSTTHALSHFNPF